MSIRQKFNAVVVVACAGLMVLAAFWLENTHSVLLSERQQKTRSLVEIPYSLLVEQHQLEISGKLSRAEAQKHALEAIRAIRYEGKNYFWINDKHPTMVMHPLKPEMDGTDLSDFKDPTGKAVFVAMRDAATTLGGGFVYYRWPKPGESEPVQKLSFVKAFEPWGWIIGTGIYVDDVSAASRRNGKVAASVGVACLLVLLLVSSLVSRAVFRQLKDMVDRIRDMAEGEGDLTKRLQIISRDEVGELAKWFNVLVDRLHGLIASVAETAAHVANASEELSATSQQISANSEETSAQANVVSQATQQVSQNLRSVSTGAGEMTATIQSIASNAHEAATVASNAVQTAQAANATVGKLGESSGEIGEVIKVITSIAQQTNLLALNATIEAARAGEAGKGFAVVANEVKELAKQTAKATEDISRKITAIQTDTKEAVDAIGSISAVINQVNDISGTIATAVEEQSATTNEMTRNVADAAKGSGEITQNIGGVAEAARATSTSAQESQKAASDLAEMAAQLRGLVAQFKINRTVDAGSAVSGSVKQRGRAAGAGN